MNACNPVNSDISMNADNPTTTATLLNIRKITLEIGIEHPLKLFHICDNHLAFTDERDNERKQELSKKRRWSFERDTNRCIQYLDEAINYSKNNCDLLIHTGDLIDFVSWPNIETAAQKLGNIDYFFAVGNHEYSKYVGEAFEDIVYKMSSYHIVQPAFKNNLFFSSRIINGVNLVSVDNSYYNFDENQLEQFKAEIGKGYPIILLMHNPLYTKDLYDELIINRKRDCAFVVGCPESLMAQYSEYRYRQQYATPITREFIRYLEQQSLVKAIITGHLHFNYETVLPSGIKQFVTGGSYNGYASEITVV
jgi:predicted phosphodiesterase